MDWIRRHDDLAKEALISRSARSREVPGGLCLNTKSELGFVSTGWEIAALKECKPLLPLKMRKSWSFST